MSLSDMRIRREFNIEINCKLNSEGRKSILGWNDIGGEIWSRLTVHNSAGVGGLVIAREIPVEKMRCWGV